MNGFLIDTNVISEFVKTDPNPAITLWFQAAPPDRLFASVVTFGKIGLGIENMPKGKRRADLENWLDKGLPGWFASNLLPVTKAIADQWARATIEAKRKGVNLTTADGLLAGTALEHGLTLVTRNTKDFSGLGVPLINPWSEQP
ncbi:MAG: type II toxin-antitoxin system VapC family toxin [Acidobacteriota bacterium]|nr:type II toxin-antitoxin system VapC family toxin [Acidobacteriota bacterium]